MASAEHMELPQTATEYVSHHLTNLTFGRIDGHWAFAHSPEEAAAMGFWAINVDSMLMSMLLGILFVGLFKFGITRMSAEAPSGKSLQNVIEMIVEMVQDSVKSSFHARNEMIGPLAMTIFVWILMMNAMTGTSGLIRWRKRLWAIHMLIFAPFPLQISISRLVSR